MLQVAFLAHLSLHPETTTLPLGSATSTGLTMLAKEPHILVYAADDGADLGPRSVDLGAQGIQYSPVVNSGFELIPASLVSLTGVSGTGDKKKITAAFNAELKRMSWSCPRLALS